MKFRIILAFATSLFFALQANFAQAFDSDKTISTTVNDQQDFGANNITLTIAKGGNVIIPISGGTTAITNAVDDITNLNVIIDANSGEGVKSGGNAIGFVNAGYTASVTLNSGTITSTGNTHTIDLNGLDTFSISVGSSGIVSNSKNYFSSEEVSVGIAAIRSDNTSNFRITNAGRVFSATALILRGGASTINNSGYIYNSLTGADVSSYINRDTISISSSGASTINNTGSIVGNISGSSGDIDITNSGSITGDSRSTLKKSRINLGSNSGSSVTLNAGTIDAYVNLGNISQIVAINGGSFTGEIDGVSSALGTINVNADFTLASGSKFGATDGVNTLSISSGANLTAQGSSKVNNFNILSGGTLTIDSNSMVGTNTTVAGTMNFGSASRTFTGAVSGSGTGTINLNTASHNIVGSLTLNAGNALGVTFAADRVVGNVATTGAATVSSDAKIFFTIGMSYAYLVDGSRYKIVDGSTGSSINTVSSDNIISSTGFSVFKFTSDVDGDDLYLELAGKISTSEATKSPNAQRAYDNIRGIGGAATGTLSDFQAYVDSSSTSAELTAALKSATPQSDDGIRQTSLNIFNNSARNIENRLDEMRAAYFGGFGDLNQESFNTKVETALAPENTYLGMRQNYLNARATFAKSEPDSLESESAYLNSRASYLKVRSAFLEAETSKLKSDLGLVKSGAAPLKTELSYLKARDGYLKAIEEFLASEPKYEKSEGAYLDSRTAYLNAKTTSSDLPISYLQAEAALQKAKANQESLLNKYLEAKDQLTKAQSQYSADSEASYLQARAAYLNSKAKLKKSNMPLIEFETKAADAETLYFKARTDYLNAKENSPKLDKASNVANLKSVYLNVRDDFLRSQQATMIEEIKFLKNSSTASKGLSNVHLGNLNRYLDSILEFLRSQQRYFDSKDSYRVSMANYSNSQLFLKKAENAFLEAKNSYRTQDEREAVTQKFLEAKTSYLNSLANPELDPEASYLKNREAYLASFETLTKASFAGVKEDSSKGFNLFSAKDPKYSAKYKKTNSFESKDLLKNINAWAQTFGINAKQNNFSGLDGEGYNLNTNGLILGIDAEISKRSRIGLALSFANSNIKALDKLKRIGVETYQINAYSGHLFGKYFIDTIGAFALSDYQSYRTISSVGATANASFNGQGYAAKIRGGYIKKLDRNFNLIPEASLILANNNVSNYSESGAGTMNLDVRSQSTNFLEGRIGLNLNYKTTTKKGSILMPQLKASYGYDFIGKRQSTVSNFAGQSTSFVTTSSKYDPSSLRLGGAVDLYRLNSVTLSSEYSLELKSGYQSHAGSVRTTYRF